MINFNDALLVACDLLRALESKNRPTREELEPQASTHAVLLPIQCVIIHTSHDYNVKCMRFDASLLRRTHYVLGETHETSFGLMSQAWSCVCSFVRSSVAFSARDVSITERLRRKYSERKLHEQLRLKSNIEHLSYMPA